jgi:RNA polymerase-binding transcription factor DksA
MAKKKSTKKAAVKKKAPSRPASKAPKKAVKKPSKAKKAPAKKVKPAPKKVSKPVSKAKVASKKRPTAPARKPAAKSVKADPKTPSPIHKPIFPIGRSKDKPVSRIPVIEEPVKPAAPKLNGKFLETQKKRLLELRDHILDQMQGVAKDGLRSQSEGSSSSAFGMHQADAGSEAYEKDFALSLLSQEQDALYEIEEALKRIENKTYGICEMSGKTIPLARLEAIPFARYTVECQTRFEQENRGKHRWETSPQFMDSTDNFFEEEEDGEEEDKTKVKE